MPRIPFTLDPDYGRIESGPQAPKKTAQLAKRDWRTRSLRPALFVLGVLGFAYYVLHALRMI